MPRAANHHHDDPSMASLYHKFDLEDLIDLIAWMREFAPEISFSMARLIEIRARSRVATYSTRLLRRIVRVGLEEGWLVETGRRQYAVGHTAPATLPLINTLTARFARTELADTLAARVPPRTAAQAFIKHVVGR
jgi:hypothetical protein